MKRSMPILAATTILAFALAARAGAESLQPGEVDFGQFSPPSSGGEFVEVNLGSNLISLAARLVPKEQREVANLLHSLQLVRVNVIGLDEENRDELKIRAQKIQKQLKAQGWERIITAKKKDQDVGIHIKMHGTNSVAGLAVIVIEGDRQAVFINIVGDVKPEQLALVGEQLNIDPLKKLGPKPRKENSEPEK